MKSKKIISGLLALSFVLGGAAIPGAVADSSAAVSASVEEIAEESDVLTYGDYKYTLLKDGTVEIAKYVGFDTEVEIPGEINGAAVTSIGVHAFSDPFIKSIDIPDSVTALKNSAFTGCWGLESISLPQNLEYIGNSAFSHCYMIESIVIPDGVKTIGSFAFSDCYNIESVVIPDSVEFIDQDAFSHCENLKSITLPEGLKEIKEETFIYCKSLESIVIPDSVNTIRAFAFSKCFNLKSVTIPDSVTNINGYAFSYYDDSEGSYKLLENVTINCNSGSYAENYAKANGLNYKLIDEKRPACPPPYYVKAVCNEQYHQIRFFLEPVDGAERYALAVYLSGKWKVITNSIPADAPVYTSPKNLTPGRTYKVAVSAKVNGKWNTSAPIKNAITVTVK